MSRFLMHYLGAGTDFPFEILDQSVEGCRDDQPIRVVISDRDFDVNFAAKQRNRDIFTQATSQSARFILLQHVADENRVRLYRSLGATVIEVQKMDDFPRLATELTFALFPEELHAL